MESIGITNSASPALNQFVDRCRVLAVGEDPVVAVAACMKRLVAKPEVLASSMTKPSEGPNAVPSGIDELLFEDEALTVVVVHSRPGVVQPPHDHLIPAVVGVFEGTEQQRYYRRQNDMIVPSGGVDVGAGQVLTLGSHAIHAISAGAVWSRAVHAYLGPLSSIARSLFDPVDFGEEPMTSERYEAFCRTP